MGFYRLVLWWLFVGEGVKPNGGNLKTIYAVTLYCGELVSVAKKTYGYTMDDGIFCNFYLFRILSFLGD